ncbi:MAG: hypothetical protein RLZZ350_2551, partial [Verrucomicrobiota bacterium]
MTLAAQSVADCKSAALCQNLSRKKIELAPLADTISP